MKANPLVIFFFLVPVSLIIGSSFLVKQTIDYRLANRKLILQNDSLQSVIIELNHEISNCKNATSLKSAK